MSLSAIRGVTHNSAYAAQNITKVTQTFGVVFRLKAFGGKLTYKSDIDEQGRQEARSHCSKESEL